MTVPYTTHDVPLWMTLAIAAPITGESRQTLWRRHRDGVLKTVQRGRTIMVTRESLLSYMGAVTTESPALSDGASRSSTLQAVPDAS